MTATESNYKGRIPGSRNRRTVALLELAEEGETPCAFALRIMRDDTQKADIRMLAARMAAPYIHPRPQPELRYIALDLPEEFGSAESLKDIHVTLLRAVASGEMSLEEAKELSAILETHRRLVETVDLEERLARIEREQQIAREQRK